MMTQPSGQVLCYPPQLRTYVRSSPIICGTDALTQLVRIGAYLLGGFSPGPRHAVARAMHLRIRGLREQGPEEGFQALENLTLVRWLLFAFGTLPQTVKLMAFKGVPWTQAWAGLSLATFVILEVFIFFGKQGAAYDLIVSPEDDEHPRARWMRTALQQLEYNLERFEDACGLLAVVAQVALLGWTFHALVRPLASFDKAVDDRMSSQYLVNLIVWMPAIFLAYLGYICLAWSCLAPNRREASGLKKLVAFVSGALSVTGYPIAVYTAFVHLDKAETLKTLASPIAVILGYATVVAVTWALGELFALNRFLRYKVLLVDRSPDLNQAAENKRWSIAAWSMFIGTTILTSLFYAIRYDSTGTYKPAWTDSLG
jgi:hypothetical protein